MRESGVAEGAGVVALVAAARAPSGARGEAHDGLAPLPTLDGLAALAAEARLAGTEVTIDRSQVRRLAPAIEFCAYRVVQEAALTNAAKHAVNPHVRVKLDGTNSDLLVLVEDDGGSGPRRGDGTGHGLLGLRERVELFGGTLDAAPQAEGGFRVRAALPVGGTS